MSDDDLLTRLQKSIRVDPEMPPGTMELRSGSNTVRVTGISAAEDDLVTWLRRAIGARRSLALGAIELGSDEKWTEISSGVLQTIAEDKPGIDPMDGLHPLGDSTLTRLMEANDPQDTIARCEAELAILDEHGPFDPAPEWLSAFCRRCGEIDDHRVAWPCRTIRLLGSGYKHRPGYREEWKP